MCNSCNTNVEVEDDFVASLLRLEGPGVEVAPAKVQAVTEPQAAEGRPAGAHNCEQCLGTGKYKGMRVHQEQTHCFNCGGRGWFKASYADRLKARAKTAERKARKADEARAAFQAAHPGLIEALTEHVGWNQLAQSLLGSFEKWHSLTDRQVAAAQSMLIKIAQKRAEKAQEKAAKTGEVSIAAIETMFNTARSNGLKRPRFVTKRLAISLAPSTGRNAGALYVKCDGDYAGKIADGVFHPARTAPDDILTLVRELAADPVESARQYGRDTGSCACCGRELTDPVSIANGIGPICEGNWF